PGEQLQGFITACAAVGRMAASDSWPSTRLTELVSETLSKPRLAPVGSSASGIASNEFQSRMTIQRCQCAPPQRKPLRRPTRPAATASGADQIFGLLQRREGEFHPRPGDAQSAGVGGSPRVYGRLTCAAPGRAQQHRRAAALLNGLASLSEAFRLLTVAAWYAVRSSRPAPEPRPSQIRGVEALRKWQPEPLSTEQLGEQFCGLVRLYATIGFFASSGPSLSRPPAGPGRPRGSVSRRPGQPALSGSGENAGRTYSRVSEPEEPFYRTALNLAKDHDLFTACFARNLDGMRKAKLVQQLPAFKAAAGAAHAAPVERVQRTLENRGRSGYEKFAGRLLIHESVVKKPEAAELENSASEARAISNRATFAAVAANKLADPTKSASASGNLLDRRPLTVNNRLLTPHRCRLRPSRCRRRSSSSSGRPELRQAALMLA
uniref:ELM2 domain-containing protein n=1 Tax=Macrostomum lignano TaxID=282301 RepID=A0A1I8JR07_9PLAT